MQRLIASTTGKDIQAHIHISGSDRYAVSAGACCMQLAEVDAAQRFEAAHGAVVEVGGELLAVQRGGCDDQPQLWPASRPPCTSAAISVFCTWCWMPHVLEA